MSTHRSAVAKVSTVLALGCALFLVGCGGQGGEESSQNSTESAPQSFDDYQLKYTQCLRDKGIDVPDPNGDGQVQITQDDSPEAMTKATEECAQELGPPPAAEADGGPEAAEEQARKSAECLRNEGIEVEDPKPGEASELPPNIPESVIAKCTKG